MFSLGRGAFEQVASIFGIRAIWESAQVNEQQTLRSGIRPLGCEARSRIQRDRGPRRAAARQLEIALQGARRIARFDRGKLLVSSALVIAWLHCWLVCAVLRRCPSRSVVTRCPNGVVRRLGPSGVARRLGPNGAVLRVAPNGAIRCVAPN